MIALAITDFMATHDGETVLSQPSTWTPALLARGTIVGRYIIVSTIGCGGLGTVYAAYDPELDRNVAIKLMRPDAASRIAATEARARMLREAKAMARLAHPNVVAVHDVGTFGESVFVAMELVEGITLRQWLAEKRTWREIIDIFSQAAQGLAAAHAVGLVHRDFKPENVLVGTDGRVRVLDFGLARAASEQAPRALSDDRVSNMLTLSGTVLGTPAYMSPEQHLQHQVDARSDQFSFCVSLYEALYGKRPFEGSSLAAIGYAATQGLIADTKSFCLPTLLRATVLRGLRVDPRERFPSMAHVIARLANVRTQRRRLLVATSIVVVVSALVLALGYAATMARTATRDDRSQLRSGSTCLVAEASESERIWLRKPARLVD